jgi:hypothetical protein
VKDWEVVADNLHKGGWSLGWVSALDREGRTIWIVDAHGYGKRFIVRADEILTAQGQKPLPCHPSSFRAIHRKGFVLSVLK